MDYDGTPLEISRQISLHGINTNHTSQSSMTKDHIQTLGKRLQRSWKKKLIIGRYIESQNI